MPSSETAQSWRQPVLIAILILVPALVFMQAVNFTLISWDDPQHTYANPHLMPLSWSGVSYFWRHPYFGLYVPVTYSFFALETFLAELLPASQPPYAAVYHLGSVCLHIANVLVVFAILCQLVRQQLPAFLGALLFAVHPLQVESVNWVSETRGLLAGLFGLMSIWLFLHVVAFCRESGVEQGSSDEPSSRNRAAPALWYLAATASFCLALLSKPSAVAIPLILAMVILVFFRSTVRWALPCAAIWLLPCAGVLFVTRGEQGAELQQFVTPLVDRPRLAGDAITFYLYKLGWPWSLSIEYGRPAWRLVKEQWTWLTAAVPVIIAVLLASLRQWMGLAILAIFVAALLPVLGLIPFPYQDYSTVADRYVYLALLAPAVLVAVALDRWPVRWAQVATAAVLAILAMRSFVQAGFWHDDRELFEHGLRTYPGSFLVQDKFGMGLLTHGHPAESLDFFLEASRINPDYAASFNNAGLALGRMQRWPEAIDQLATAARLAPTNATIRMNLGDAFLWAKDNDRAEHCYAEAARLDPDSTRARLAYGLLLAQRQDYEHALAELDAVLRREPENNDALYTKATILIALGKTAQADACLVSLLRVNSNHPRAREVLRSLREKRDAKK